MLFMGIDIGTTNVKMALYDRQGTKAVGSQFATPTVSPRPGWFEFEPDELWSRLSEEAARLLGPGGRGKEVVSVAVSSQGETGLLVDRDNRPLTNMLAWYDNRTLPYMKAWESRISEQELFRITGLQLHYIPSLPKLEWLRDHSPEAYGQADRWHCVSDYVTRKICGVAAMDYSIASRTMAFDVGKGEWSSRLLELAGIREDLMPPLLPAGTPLGNVLPEVAERWGLPPDAQAAVGGHDHPCGCIGLGANRGDMVIASIGTTESVCLFREQAGLTDSPPGYQVGRHVYPDAYYWLGGIPAGGETIDWAIRMLLRKEPDTDSYAEFIELAGASPPGSNGILFLPQLKGCVTPVVDPGARGGFWGLGIDSSRGDLCRAVMEGLAYEFRFVLEQTDMDVRSITAFGGGAKNSLWMQIKADVLNKEVRSLDIEDTATFGAAYLAGLAVGEFDDRQGFTARVKETFRPDPANAGLYEKEYLNRYKLLYGLQKRLRDETAD